MRADDDDARYFGSVLRFRHQAPRHVERLRRDRRERDVDLRARTGCFFVSFSMILLARRALQHDHGSLAQ